MELRRDDLIDRVAYACQKHRKLLRHKPLDAESNSSHSRIFAAAITKHLESTGVRLSKMPDVVFQMAEVSVPKKTCSPASRTASTGSDRRQPRHDRRHPLPSHRRRQNRCAQIGGNKPFHAIHAADWFSIIRVGAKMAVIRRRVARRAVSSHAQRAGKVPYWESRLYPLTKYKSPTASLDFYMIGGKPNDRYSMRRPPQPRR